MRRLLKKIKFAGAVLLTMLMFSSCLKDDSAEKQAEHDRKLNDLKAEYSMTDADMLEEGIYRKIVSQPSDNEMVDTLKGSDYLIVDVLGRYAFDDIFDASNADQAEAAGIYRDDLIYGPYRLKLDRTFYGFYQAMLGLREGTQVNMVFSQDVAFLDYNPLAYEVKLHRVIHDLDQYNIEQNSLYIAEMGIDPQVDIVPDTDSLLLWKLIEPGTDSVDLEIGDLVYLQLFGYYVEADPSYVQGFPGRQFFPISESGDSVVGEVGVQSFPVINSLYAAIQYMTLGETRDIFVPAEYAYGEDGFVHPYVNKYIIPTNMSLHYRIKLIGHKKWNEK